ncbi:hypothetical protein ASC71_15435 [Rhizobium sp. Root1240]|nr:hypothetical protein ASC71_15435 [Rhizobium sp. Root1240]
MVAFHITIHLRPPISLIRLSLRSGLPAGGVITEMGVPIASPDFDDLLSRAKYEIGLAWQVLAVETIAVAQSIDQASDCEFGTSIL